MRRFMFLVLALVAAVSFSARATNNPAEAGSHVPSAPVQAGTAHAPFTAEDMLNTWSVSVADLSDDGARVAVTMRRSADNAEVDNYRYGDPTYVSPSRARLVVIDTHSGATQTPFKDELVNVTRAAWSHDNRRLAIVLADAVPAAPPAKGTRPARQAAPAPATAKGPAIYVWDTTGAALTQVPLRPDVMVSTNTGLDWTMDDAAVFVTLRSPEWEREARDRYKHLTTGPIIVHSSKEPFLEWDALQRSARKRILAEVSVATGESRRILAEQRISSYNVSRDGSFVTLMEDVTEKTDYDEIGGTSNRLTIAGLPAFARAGSEASYGEASLKRGSNVEPRGGGKPSPTGEGDAPKTIVEAKDLKGLTLRWSDDGRTFAYAKKGEIFVQRVDETKARSLTPPPPEKDRGEAETGGAATKGGATKGGASSAPTATATTAPTAATARTVGAELARPDAEKESFSVVSFNRDGSRLLITSKKGWYVVNVADARREQIRTLNADDEETAPKIDALDWSPDGADIYVTCSERTRWERGLQRLTIATKKLTPLVKDSRLYTGFRMARDGRSFVFLASDGDRPADLYVADSNFSSVHKLTDSNPWMADRLLPRSELVSYRDADGKLLYGVLRYPVNYVKGQKYPTVFEIYETFFDNGFNARAAFLANNGYAVFHPSVNLVIGHPGEAWVKGVTSAANKLIDMGVADPDRLGVHGTSYGGYATVLLLTQTDRFKAAVNVSGKVDMVSFYTDSPRLGVRNIHAPEKSQDRLGATLWEHPERYLDHSAILHADRIATPLLCITGDQDPNVPASQSREIYYALRRLGKEVEWVRYVNGAHRPPNSAAESVDFEKRILGWYDQHLKGDLKKKTTT